MLVSTCIPIARETDRRILEVGDLVTYQSSLSSILWANKRLLSYETNKNKQKKAR